jgi:phosphoribosylformylglycinamidine synthase
MPSAWRVAATLFGESASRIVVSAAQDAAPRVLAAAAAAGVPAAVIGRTGGTDIRIDVDGAAAVRTPVAEAEQAWATVIGRRMQSAAGAA